MDAEEDILSKEPCSTPVLKEVSNTLTTRASSPNCAIVPPLFCQPEESIKGALLSSL